MKNRTTIDIPLSELQINHSSGLITIGSCFADRIGSRLDQFKFRGLYNPYGVIYNPSSILTILKSAINNIVPKGDHFCKLHDRVVHYDYHSDISATDQSAYNDRIAHVNEQVRTAFSTSGFLVITLGSAFVYRLKDKGTTISNCHKQAGALFDRFLMTEAECYKVLQEIVNTTKSINKNLSILWTVSPVRHVRDGLIQSSRSKAHLLSAVHRIVAADSHSFYFPSYEIMLDDLRDYRYYEADLIHPSAVALDYIWDLFVQQYFPKATSELVNKIKTIQNAANHRPFNPQSTAHQLFVKATLDKIASLEQEYSLGWEEEIGKLTAK